jgi:hypothetical protein
MTTATQLLPAADASFMRFLGTFLAVLLLPISPAYAQRADRDCGSDSRCASIAIQGDVAATLQDGRPSNFRGFADPSLRKDPESRALWLAYSWPKLHIEKSEGRKGRLRSRSGGAFDVAPGVDVHLARSEDGGVSWRLVKNLWPSHKDTNASGANEPGYTSYEVPNLLPVVATGRTVWYAARVAYFIPTKGGFKQRPPGSLRVQILHAPSPPELSTARPITLGAAKTDRAWGVDVDLSSLSQEVRHCMIWNEPALYLERGQLYLALRCLAFSGRTPDMTRSDLFVFATDITGGAGNQWRYVGRLGGAREAKELGGDSLTQIDIARGRDGRLLLITSPDAWNASMNEFVHFGCAVIELESINPPQMARTAAGKLKVRAFIQASDQMPLGPGACAYDPDSKTGVILTRRHKERGLWMASIHATSVQP